VSELLLKMRVDVWEECGEEVFIFEFLLEMEGGFTGRRKGMFEVSEMVFFVLR
jgi:hypothetical protein